MRLSHLLFITILTINQVLAERPNVSHIGLSIAGMFTPWEVGVFKVLETAGIVTPGVTKISGGSGGALFAALCAGGSVDTINDFFQLFSNPDIVIPPPGSPGVLSALEYLVNAIIPANVDDQTVRRLCNGKAYIQLSINNNNPPNATTASGNCGIPSKSDGWLVSKFDSRQDLVDATVASEYAVGNADVCSVIYDDMMVNDALYTNGIPCGTDENCLRISVFGPNVANNSTFTNLYPGQWDKVTIYPGSNGTLLFDPSFIVPENFFNITVVAPYLDLLYQLGLIDGLGWIIKNSN